MFGNVIMKGLQFGVMTRPRVRINEVEGRRKLLKGKRRGQDLGAEGIHKKFKSPQIMPGVKCVRIIVNQVLKLS